MAVTAPIASIQQKVNAAFGPTGSKGDYNCRNIRGSSTPSQHAWGNAWDIDVYGPTAQRPYVDFLEGLPEAGTILWASNEPTMHYDHIHVEGVPKQTGVPPCMGGTGGIKEGTIPPTGKAGGEGFWDWVNPFDNWSSDVAQLLVRSIYLATGIAALAVGAAFIVNDITNGQAFQAAKAALPAGKLVGK